jgi:hypothetical protein
MDMEIKGLADLDWLSIVDLHSVAVWMAWSSHTGAWTAPEASSDNRPQRVPMLDWPATLFADETAYG